MPFRFAILGSGTWGSAVALLLARKPDRRVSLWSARARTEADLQSRRNNFENRVGAAFPSEVFFTGDIKLAVAAAELLIVAVPTAYLRETMQRIAGDLPPQKPTLSLVKGVERETFERPSEILQEITGPRPVAVLSGPSHAEEVVRGLPTSLVVASENESLSRQIQQLFSTDRIRVYTNLDVIGVELAGALKNVIAIAAGLCDGLQLGDNAKSALITRGLVEMTRFGVAQGAEPATFAGLAGMGDLIATCISPHGRNRHVGECLARGQPLQEILDAMNMVAEGVTTAQSVHQQSQQLGIAMPITEAVYRILYEGKDPQQALTDLMLRSPKSEAV